MKILNIFYWTTVVVIALLSVGSAYGYLTQTAMQEGFKHLGFPDYFRIELAIAKVIGAVLLVIPVGWRIKEWTYAGFAITYVSAFIAHSSLSDQLASKIFPAIALALLAGSYLSYRKRGTIQSKSPESIHYRGIPLRRIFRQ